MTKQPEPLLWLNDARGIYIPRDFAKSFNDRAKAVSGVSDEDWAILEDPDHEFYCETWQDVCDNAVITDPDGIKYTVYQDGDCWLIPVGMEWDDETDFFVWPQGE
jgi:hypothetical protein